MDETFRSHEVQDVVHLAAQVGVRASVDKPRSYVDTNVVGFLHVLESCRHHHIRHPVYASSNSVYGSNTKVPYSVHDPADHPISLYAATKRSNELMAHAYSHLFGLPTTGLRFFEVYGRWSRPDMAPILFARAIVEGRPIDVFNHGEMERDFTYVGDVVEGIVRVLDHVPSPDPEWTGAAPSPAASAAPYRVYNIGNSSPVRLMDMIEALEEALGRHAERNYLPMQEGDMRQTYADVEDFGQDVGYRPATDLRDGIRAFAEWFVEYYQF